MKSGFPRGRGTGSVRQGTFNSSRASGTKMIGFSAADVVVSQIKLI